jgi:hypothetical protein
MDQGLAEALALVLRPDGNRSETVPARGAVRDRHGRERNVTHHPAVEFRDQGHGQRPGGAQCLDNELLGVVADRQGRKGCHGHLGDGADVGGGFSADACC